MTENEHNADVAWRERRQPDGWGKPEYIKQRHPDIDLYF